MKNLLLFENFAQQIDEAEKGLMHKLLNVPEKTKISSKYKSGKKLADDLVAALDRSKIVPKKDVKKKAASMLAFAANWPSDGPNSVVDKALRAVRNVTESEVVIADEPKAEGTDEKLYVQTGNDRALLDKKIKNKATAEGYIYETGKRKLTGTDGSNPPYTLKVVMTKKSPE